MPRPTPSPSFLPVAAAVVLLTALAACGGGEPAEEPPAPAPDAAPQAPAVAPETPAGLAEAPAPCELLTAEEIEAATGVPPGDGEDAAGGCSWAAADGTNPRLLVLAVLRGDLTREQWLSGGGAEEDIVEGVGDIAIRVGSQLQVFQDGWLVGVTVRGSESPDAARVLAEAVHAKLGT